MVGRRALLLFFVLSLRKVCGFEHIEDDCVFKVDRFKDLVSQCGEANRGFSFGDFSAQFQQFQEEISIVLRAKDSPIQDNAHSVDFESIKNAVSECNSKGIIDLKQQIQQLTAITTSVSFGVNGAVSSVNTEVRSIKDEQKKFAQDLSEKMSALTSDFRSFAAAVVEVKTEQSRFKREVTQKFADMAKKLEAIKQNNLETFSTVQNSQAICPSSGLNLTKLANGKKYYFSYDEFVSWNEAMDFCEKNKMHLPSPKTQQELDYLFKRTKEIGVGSLRWWLSATDFGQEPGDFRWHDGSQLANNSPLWYYEQPDDFGKGKENCVVIYTGYHAAKFGDTSCSL